MCCVDRAQFVIILTDSYVVCTHVQHFIFKSSYPFLLRHTQLNLAEPFLLCKTDTKAICEIDKEPSAVCLVSLDHFIASQERKRENKTVRISAIPTVIFITTTWVERKRERFTKYCERVLSLQEVCQTNKLDFSHLECKGMQSQDKMKKTNSEKVKQRLSKDIEAETRMRRHIHRLKSVILGRWNFVLLLGCKGTGVFRKHRNTNYLKSQVEKLFFRTSSRQEALTLWGPEGEN